MRTILISGCSSGFGALCALEFAAAGDRVVATMRNLDRSGELQEQARNKNVTLHMRALDVSNPASIESCVSSVIEEFGQIDVLINNAGIHLLAAVEDMADADFRRLFETNFFGAINLARAVLPSMRERGRGHIITLSSIGSRIGRATDGIYCASKAAVETAFEAMRYEVARFGVNVSVVCPGAFKTNITQNVKMPENYTTSPYADLVQFRAGKVHESCANGGDPLEVAQLIMTISKNSKPDFRYLAGQQALHMDRELTPLNDADRTEMITRLAGIGWWVSGSDLTAGNE
ncbi:SDR family oxidoreductase [Govanella unica]|uniref:SDR family oxidoreductase n=1 Tax=Govanella unica TaxID=2975056 RepID=A0A9X3TXM9_9PROT|nr:SDR family oxidoreductase [Govania unica]MDA5193866.1 SDR family oxidoreductase [Govania unica]